MGTPFEVAEPSYSSRPPSLLTVKSVAPSPP